MIYRLPIGLIIAAALIMNFAVPYMQWVNNSRLLSFGAALSQLSPTIALQLGGQVWIPTAGVLLALGVGLMLATVLVHGFIHAFSALTMLFRVTALSHNGAKS